MTDTNERALIGALLSLAVPGAKKARSLFDRDDLDDPRHRVVLDLIDHCLAEDRPADPAAVFAAARTTALVDDSRLGQVGALLADLHTSLAHAHWAHIYAAGVIEASVRRRLREASQRLLQAADTSDLSAAMRVTSAEAVALSACVARIQQGAKS